MSMKARLIVGMSLFVVAGFNLYGGLDGSLMLSLSADRTEFRAAAEAVFYSSGDQIDYNASLTGSVNVEQTTPAVNYEFPVDRRGSYGDILEGPTEFGACYYSSMQVTGDPWGPFNSETRTWNAGPACYTTQPPPHGDPPPEFINPGSPIILSLGGSYSLSGANDPVVFDIDGDGLPDSMGWTARGSNDVFLALDRNDDGRINNGRELFGDATILRNGSEAGNGFEALKDLDDNGDGRLDPQDPVWGSLLVWRDENHDGISGSSEVDHLTQTAVRGIGLDYDWSGRIDRHGNEFRYRAQLDVEPGSRVHRQVYDVYFVVLR